MGWFCEGAWLWDADGGWAHASCGGALGSGP
jgi:hypothetical protein